MTTQNVASLLRDLLVVAFKVGGPLLILSMIVGLLLAVFQAVTQIHEQTLGFVMKLVVVVGVLLLGGGWMMETMLDFVRNVFAMIAA